MKCSVRCAIMCLAVIAQMAAVSVYAAPSVDQDLDSHWASLYLLEGIQRAWIAGYPDGTIRPDNAVTRSELAAMICRLAGKEDDGRTAARMVPAFADLSSNHWALGYIRICKEMGILRGEPDGGIRADAIVTRAEMAAMVSRLLTYLGAPRESPKSVSYADKSEVPDWALDAVAGLTKLGIIRGDDTGNFRPYSGTSRAESVAVLARVCDVCGMRWDIIGTIEELDLATDSLRLGDDGRVVTVSIDQETRVFSEGLVGLGYLKRGFPCKIIMSRTPQARARLIVVGS